MGDKADREVTKLQRDLECIDRHPYSRYGCEAGCGAIYEHPRILGSLGSPWYCPDHDPDDPRRVPR